GPGGRRENHWRCTWGSGGGRGLRGQWKDRGEAHESGDRRSFHVCHGCIVTYRPIALSRITMRAISSALARVISPSFIIPVSAIANASRADVVVCQPISSQSIRADPGDRSVPNSTFSGYHSNQ